MTQRQIKFRVWDKNQKIMFYFDNLEFNSEYNLLAFGCDWKKYGFSFGSLSLEDDAPVMQFTGLLDKNGKEIFEGDIVKSGNYERKVFEVEYTDCGFSPFAEAYFGCEVIGNLYESPELLN